MGCDIHLFAEKRNKPRIDTDAKGSLVPDLIIPPKPTKIIYGFSDFDQEDDYEDPGLWTAVSIPDSADNFFNNRDYALFGFLAGVRNYCAIQPISEPRGLPDDVSWSVRNSLYQMEYHSISWLLTQELLRFNYDLVIENRRRNGDTVPPGQGEMTTYGALLGGQHYLKALSELAKVADRIVFGFDN